MRCELIAEICTNYAGDVGLAADMITAAAEAGADWVKTQAYQVKHLRKDDPQYDWLKQCELSVKAHKHLREVATTCGVQYLTTVFHPKDAERLPGFHFKVGSGEHDAGWVKEVKPRFVSSPWCVNDDDWFDWIPLVTVPLYPMPPECFRLVDLRPGFGWSDHAVGIDVAKIAIARGAPVVEKHFSLPGQGRNQAWDMTPAMLRELRQWAETCAVALDGTRYQGRWQGGLHR